LDIPKETISAALGHEIGSSTTSIYINFDQKKVDDANRKVIDFLLGKKKSEKGKIFLASVKELIQSVVSAERERVAAPLTEKSIN